MKNQFKFLLIIICALVIELSIVSCNRPRNLENEFNQTSIKNPTWTNTPESTNTPLLTLTPIPTSTITPIPTPLGGVSPKIAFYGQGSDGVIYLYIGNMYENKLTPIEKISDSLLNIGHFPIRWSPDGKNIAYVGHDEENGFGLFILNAEKGENKFIYKISKFDWLYDLSWSFDMKSISFELIPAGTRSSSKITVNLDENQIKNPPNSYCYSSYLCEIGAKQIDNQIYYPSTDITTELDNGNKLYMISSDKTKILLASFPNDVTGWNGGLEVHFSPNRQYAILVCPNDMFFYPIKLTNIPYNLSKEDMVKYEYYYDLPEWESKSTTNSDIIISIPSDIQEIKDENYSIMMGWSPDSHYYIYENYVFYGDPTNDYYQFYKDNWHFNIQNIDSNEIVFVYKAPVDISPIITAGQDYGGFDVYW